MVRRDVIVAVTNSLTYTATVRVDLEIVLMTYIQIPRNM